MELTFPDLTKMPAIQEAGIANTERAAFTDAVGKYHAFSAAAAWGGDPENVYVHALGHKWTLASTMLADCYLLSRPEPAAEGGNEALGRQYALYIHASGNNGLHGMEGTLAWVTFVPWECSNLAWDVLGADAYALIVLMGTLRQAYRERQEFKQRNAGLIRQALEEG